MAEAITLETRGRPVAALAVDTLARTVGKSMARMHGFPNYPLVQIEAPFFESVAPTDQDFERKAALAVQHVERLLFSGTVEE